MSPRHRSYLMLLIVSVIWGFATPIVKYAFNYFPPDIFLLYRFAISCLVMIPILFYTQPHTWHILSETSTKTWVYLIIGGLLGSVFQLGLLFVGLNLTSSLDASIVNATSPILVAIAGFYLLRERISLREKTGLFISFLGSLIIIIQPLLESGKLFSGSILGNLLVFLGTLSWAGYVILTKRQLRHAYSPLFLTTFMFFTGFVTLFFWIIFRYTPYQLNSYFTTPPSAHFSVFYMALLSGSLAYWLYQKAQKSIEVSEANIFLYLPPLFTAPLSYFWLHEPLTLPLVIGCLVIAIGVILAQTRTHRR